MLTRKEVDRIVKNKNLILFRVWDPRVKEMYYSGTDDLLIGSWDFREDGWRVTRNRDRIVLCPPKCKLMQSYGVFDIDEKRMFVGDILEKKTSMTYSRVLLDVDINDTYLNLTVFDKNFNFIGKHIIRKNEIKHNGYRIIGNIYENPDLYEFDKKKNIILENAKTIFNKVKDISSRKEQAKMVLQSDASPKVVFALLDNKFESEIDNMIYKDVKHRLK